MPFSEKTMAAFIKWTDQDTSYSFAASLANRYEMCLVNRTQELHSARFQ